MQMRITFLVKCSDFTVNPPIVNMCQWIMWCDFQHRMEMRTICPCLSEKYLRSTFFYLTDHEKCCHHGLSLTFFFSLFLVHIWKSTGIERFSHGPCPWVSRWSTAPCLPGSPWILMDPLLKTSSWSPTWESACCSASRAPARPNTPALPYSPQIISPYMILLSKAAASATDMLTTVFQPGATSPASTGLVTWWALWSWIIWTYSLQVHDSAPTKHSCTVFFCPEKSLRCCVLQMVSICLHFCWCGEIGSKRFWGIFARTTPLLLNWAVACCWS